MSKKKIKQKWTRNKIGVTNLICPDCEKIIKYLDGVHLRSGIKIHIKWGKENLM